MVQLAMMSVVQGMILEGGGGSAGGQAAAAGGPQGVQQAGGSRSGSGGSSVGGSASFWERGWEDAEVAEASVRARLLAEAVTVELPRLAVDGLRNLRGSVSTSGREGAGAAAACGYCNSAVLEQVDLAFTWCPLLAVPFVRGGGFQALAQLEGMAPRLLLAQLAATCVMFAGTNTDPRTPDGSRFFLEPRGPGEGIVRTMLGTHGWAVAQMAEGGMLPVLRCCFAMDSSDADGTAWGGLPAPPCSWHQRRFAWTWLGPCAMLRPSAVAGPPLWPAGEVAAALFAKAAARDLAAAEREVTACLDPLRWHELDKWTTTLHDEIGQASGVVGRKPVGGRLGGARKWLAQTVGDAAVQVWGTWPSLPTAATLWRIASRAVRRVLACTVQRQPWGHTVRYYKGVLHCWSGMDGRRDATAAQCSAAVCCAAIHLPASVEHPPTHHKSLWLWLSPLKLQAPTPATPQRRFAMSHHPTLLN